MNHNLKADHEQQKVKNPNVRAERIFSELMSDGYGLRDVLSLSSQLLSLAMVELKKS